MLKHLEWKKEEIICVNLECCIHFTTDAMSKCLATCTDINCNLFKIENIKFNVRRFCFVLEFFFLPTWMFSVFRLCVCMYSVLYCVADGSFPLCSSSVSYSSSTMLQIFSENWMPSTSSHNKAKCVRTEQIFVKNHNMLVANKWNDDNNQETRVWGTRALVSIYIYVYECTWFMS